MSMTPSVFKARLNSILKDNAIERFVSNKKRGALNTKRLYKIANSEKIFKEKEERKGKDYSVTLLLDVSGSMSSKMPIVKQATIDLLSIFDKLNIPTSVYCFGEVTRQAKKFSEKFSASSVNELIQKAYKLNYHLCCNYDCKAYDLEFDSSIKRSDRRCPDCGGDNLAQWDNNGGTNDAYALHVVANEVCKVYAKNILIVLTDGRGDTFSYDDKRHIGLVKFSEIRNIKFVLKKLYKDYKDLIVVAVDINSGHCENVYGKQNSYYIEKGEETFKAVTTLLARKIKRV